MADSKDNFEEYKQQHFVDYMLMQGMFTAASGVRHVASKFKGVDGELVAEALANIIEESARNIISRSDTTESKVIPFPSKIDGHY